MNNAVHTLVSTYCDAYFQDLFSEVENIVETFEIDLIEDELTVLAMTESSQLDESAQTTITSIIVRYLDSLLRDHEIVLNDSALLDDFIAFSEVLKNLQDCQEREAIINVIATKEDPIEVFAQLCSIVSTIGIGKVYNTVDSVSTELIAAIERLYKDKADEVGPENYSEDYVRDLIFLRDYIVEVKGLSSNEIGAFQIVAQGIRIGNIFSNYYNLIKHRLDGRDADFLSYQFLALLYLGVDSSKSILTYWREHNEQYFDNLELLAAVTMRIEAMIVEFDKYKSQKALVNG